MRPNRSVFALTTLATALVAVGTAPAAEAPSGLANHGTRLAPDASNDVESFQAWLTGPIELLLTTEEARTASRLQTPTRRAAFRQWFWARRDPSPETARNEVRDRFWERVAFVNKELGDPYADKPGWQTAAGRIYVVLGPPSAVVRKSNGLIVRGSFHHLQVWLYNGGAAGGGELLVPFAETTRGLELVSVAGSSSDVDRLRSALAAAALATIHRPDLAFDSGHAAGDLAAPLPLDGHLRLEEGGLAGDFSLPVGELYGHSTDTGLRIEIRVSLLSDGDELADPSPMATEQLLGAVVLDLRSEDLKRWLGRRLRVALWMSSDVLPRSGLTRLLVTETATGRQGVLRVRSKADPAVEMPDSYPVAKPLCAAVLADGRGMAFAFMEAEEAGAAGSSQLWLARHSSALDGSELPLPGPGFRLLSVPVPVASTGRDRRDRDRHD